MGAPGGGRESGRESPCCQFRILLQASLSFLFLFLRAPRPGISFMLLLNMMQLYTAPIQSIGSDSYFADKMFISP